MKNRLIWMLVSSLMILSLVMVSCGGAEEEPEPKQPPPQKEEPTGPTGTIRSTINDFTIESMDPNNTAATWGGAMYDTVMSWDDKGNNIESAAKSWTLSDDGLTWTFKLQPNGKFHNGDPVTSADFAFSIERFMDEKSTNPWAPRLRTNYDSMSTPDSMTYVHKTKTPELTLVATFAALPILPSKYIQAVGMDEFNKKPIGSGPWKMVNLVPDTSIEFEANEDYWDGSPYFAKVLELEVPEEATRVGMLKRDEVDLIFVSTDRIVELRDEGYRLQEISLPTVGTINLSGSFLTDGPIKDIRVRKALSYSINRQEIADTFYRGLAKNSGVRWFMSDVTWGWDPNWKADPYDPTMAKKLLDEAGYPQAFSTPTIGLFTTAPNADLMLILQGYWKELGIDVDVQVVEGAKFFDLMFVRATKKTDEVVGQIWPWVSGNTFQNVYHSSNMFTSVGVHTTANDPEMDVLYDAVLKETDPEKQKQMWTDFTQRGYDMFVSIGLLEVPTYWVVSDKLGEFSKGAHLFRTNAWAGIKHP